MRRANDTLLSAIDDHDAIKTMTKITVFLGDGYWRCFQRLYSTTEIREYENDALTDELLYPEHVTSRITTWHHMTLPNIWIVIAQDAAHLGFF
jgi:hypothetical protein